MIKLKLGSPAEATETRCCLTCRWFRTCQDPSKSFDYRCTSFIAISDVREDGGVVPAAPKPRDVYITFPRDGGEPEYRKAKPRRDVVIEYPRSDAVQRDRILRELDSMDEDDGFRHVLLDMLETDHVGMPRDIKVNDRDFPLAPNFVTFANDPEFLAYKPFAKQMEIGTKLFNDYCPHCSNMKYLRDVPLDDTLDDFLAEVCLLEHGVCPECDGGRAEFLRQGLQVEKYELAGLAGQRSGKSAVTAMIFAYLLHWYLKLQNPPKYFHQLDNAHLFAYFVATDFNQARDTLWTPFAGLVNDSPWYKGYHEMLADLMERSGDDNLFKLRDTFLTYNHRRLSISPHGPNMRSQRGRTTWGYAIDEIGHFDASEEGKKKIRLSAHEVHQTLDNSMSTIANEAYLIRREGVNHVPNPIACNISSPLSITDMIHYLVNQSKKPRSTIYGFHYATWEMNPRFPFDGPYLTQKREANAAGFWRDYGAKPTMSANSFVGDLETIRNCINRALENAGVVWPEIVESSSGQEVTTAQIKWNWSDKQVPKLLTLDPGWKHNSFAFAVQHVDPDQGIVYDMIGEVLPKEDAPINFTFLYEDVLVPVIEKMNVKMVVSDRWQNLKMLSDMEEDTGVTIDQYSLTYTDFLQWRDGHQNGDFQLPRAEIKLTEEMMEKVAESYPQMFYGKPIAHLVMQMLTVIDIPGKTVDKGIGDLTDDIFRAIVLGYTYLTNPELAGRFAGAIQPSQQGGALVALSGGSGANAQSDYFALSRGSGAAGGGTPNTASAITAISTTTGR